MAASARGALALAASVAFVVDAGGHSAKQLAAEGGPTAYLPTMVKMMDHPSQPFTQGLEFTPDEKYLVETSGAYPEGTKSYIRMVDPQTGQTVGQPSEKGLLGEDASGTAFFVEGITSTKGKWYASTYEDHKVAEYDDKMSFLKWHNYPWQGWGFASSPDEKSFYATNGSEWVMQLKPDTFEMVQEKQATCLGKPLKGLNELEMVRNFQGTGKDILFGNVYTTRLVVGIDPDSGKCVAVFELAGLDVTDDDEKSGFHVANGIAYRPSDGHWIVTGKNWANMFEISLDEDTMGAAKLSLAEFLGVHQSLMYFDSARSTSDDDETFGLIQVPQGSKAARLRHVGKHRDAGSAI